MYRNSDYFIFGAGSIEGINLSVFPDFVENTIHSRIVSSPRNFFFFFSLTVLFFALKYRHTSFIILHFIVLHGCCVLYKLNKSISTTDSTAVAYFMSLCHILIIFQSFVLLLYLLWSSVIFDASVVIVLVYHKLCSYKMAN